MKVMNLWIIYLVVLVGLSLIFYVIVSKNNKLGFGGAAFIAALLSGIIVYFVAMYNVNIDEISQDEKNSLNALYITMGAVLLFGFIFLVFSIASNKNNHMNQPNGRVVKEIKLSDCSVSGEQLLCRETIKEKFYNNDGSVLEEEFMVNENGGMTPKKIVVKAPNGDKFKMSLLV